MSISDGERNSYKKSPSYHDYDHHTTINNLLSKKYLTSDFESSAESDPEQNTKVQLEDISRDGSARVLFSNLTAFTSHRLAVAAFNARGAGPFSRGEEFATAEDGG